MNVQEFSLDFDPEVTHMKVIKQHPYRRACAGKLVNDQFIGIMPTVLIRDDVPITPRTQLRRVYS